MLRQHSTTVWPICLKCGINHPTKNPIISSRPCDFYEIVLNFTHQDLDKTVIINFVGSAGMFYFNLKCLHGAMNFMQGHAMQYWNCSHSLTNTVSETTIVTFQIVKRANHPPLPPLYANPSRTRDAVAMTSHHHGNRRSFPRHVLFKSKTCLNTLI